MTLKKILVPIDFSEHSEKALNWALSLAAPEAIPIIIFHVIPQSPTEWLTRVVAEEKRLEAELRADAERRLQEITVGKAVPIETLVVWGGNPWDEICVLAARQGVDLIVMGTHGRTGLDRMLVGSVAERVICHAPCSVLAVRARKEEQPAAGA
jgi:nucleotide-binding universal stress UspA family protein